MKKIVSILAASMMLLGVNAMAQPSIGAGYLSSTEISKSGNNTRESNPMNGFYAGLGYTVPIASGINFTPGVYFGYAAKSNTTAFGPFSATGKQQDMYIDVPLHFSYGIDLGAARLFFYGGPSANIGLVSKVTGSTNVTGSSSYDRYEENSNLQRFDIMLGAGVGLQFNDLVRFQVGYDWGMLNRYNSDNYTVRRNQLTAGVAFLF